MPGGREKVLIDMEDLKKVLETRSKIKKEKTHDEHSVPDCVEQTEFEFVADKGTQTEEVIRHTLFKEKNAFIKKASQTEKCSD